LNAAAPQTDAPAAVLVTTNIKTPCPAVPRRGPEAGEHHKQNFSNLSYPHETAMTHFFSIAGNFSQNKGRNSACPLPLPTPASCDRVVLPVPGLSQLWASEVSGASPRQNPGMSGFGVKRVVIPKKTF